MLVNKSYYPSIPTEGITAKGTIGKLMKSNEEIVEIGADDEFICYLTRSPNEGNPAPYKNLKSMITSNGWKFKNQLGLGFIFTKEKEEFIEPTQMWTKKYIISQVPIN